MDCGENETLCLPGKIGGTVTIAATLVTGTDLVAWANRRDAQHVLPALLRRLVHATVERPIRVGFPAGEAVQLGGWDGIVAVEDGTAFVPAGTSAWELSVNRDVKAKADTDYAKRCNDPRGVDPGRSAFVFVTSRRWGGKDGWAEARRLEGVWREVRAYDADDLEAWLEVAPAVHTWFSILVGKHPEGAEDVDGWWSDWTSSTRPALTTGLILSGRADAASRVLTWLRDPAQPPFAIQADSRDEALAVFVGSAFELPLDERVTYLSRAVIVYDTVALRRLATSLESLILILAVEDADAVARATRTGHRVVLPLGRADSVATNTVIVPRLSRDEAITALVSMGLTQERADDLASLARRSLASLRRRIAVSPEVQQPRWARPEEGRALIPVVLASMWRDAEDGDRRVLSTLAGMPYDELSRLLVRWSNESDPPVRLVAGIWLVISHEDTWWLLGRYVTRDDAERLQAVSVDVFGVPDPRFDLPQDQHWRAAVVGRTLPHSAQLREGLAETLAVMGARAGALVFANGASAADCARWIVRRVLEIANTDWRVWASLSRVLSLFAEAAPDVFLAAVDEGLDGDQPILRLFGGGEANPLLTLSPYVGLLWALETVAWSHEYLGHVAVILAKLVRLDPGGMLRNRPGRSLRGIFLPWHPQTAASLEQRLRVVDAVRAREPGAAWQLLCQLLPEAHSTAEDNPRPRWREWAPDGPVPVTRAEYFRGISETVTRMLADVGESGARWADLISALGRLPRPEYDAVVGGLATVDTASLSSSERGLIWNAMRQLIARHRAFPGAEWALSRERLGTLDDLRVRFEPRDAFSRYGWLFTDSPDLPGGREEDWRVQEQAVAAARDEAARVVHAEGGLDALLDFARIIASPGDLGMAAGRSDLLIADEDGLLYQLLTATDAAHGDFARGFAIGRVISRGREWAEAKVRTIASGWLPEQRAKLLLCLPVDGRTLDLAAACGGETETQYWLLVSPWALVNDPEQAARKFLELGRPYRAIAVLSTVTRGRRAVAGALIASVLESALHTSLADDPPQGQVGYYVSDLFDVLIESGEVDEGQIAALEWGFLPLFERHERTPRLLHRELGRNPKFFVDLVALAYRADGEEPRELSPEEQARARNAYDVLESWRTVPGATTDDVDTAAFRTWVEHARTANARAGRASVGDRRLGHILSGSPAGPDGVWPHPVVRDVIEECCSVDLEQAVELSVFNGRGMVTRRPGEGGVQEHEIADRYAGFAATLADRWHRTAAMLRRMADDYRIQARREDQETELREDLGRWPLDEVAGMITWQGAYLRAPNQARGPTRDVRAER